ncbi:uncharacterized protein LOC122254489 isoform X2 [Penaeus japonicus]|uniref:uncharacterized protein LOC122254489 isoform X2 n=1 Tax=Penaeus japonicus TaxID=27405 RepID=UPI001C70C9DD|nr:uncharacterized protein LOC122254489 isoform X2 [Penaeus japonicus]
MIMEKVKRKRTAGEMEGTPHMMVVSVGGKVLSPGMQMFSMPEAQCQQLPVIMQIENATSNIQASDANVPLTDARFEGKEDHNYGNEIHAPASMDHVMWTDDAVFYLCERVRHHHSELAKSDGNKFTMRNILESVYKDMRERNFNFTSAQVETKWYTLNTVYMRNLKKMMNKESVRWKFFDVMNDLIHTTSKSKSQQNARSSQKQSVMCEQSQPDTLGKDPEVQSLITEDEKDFKIDKLIAAREQCMTRVDDQFTQAHELEKARFENEKVLRAEVSQLSQEVSVLKKICVEQLKVQKNTEKLIERIALTMESFINKSSKSE